MPALQNNITMIIRAKIIDIIKSDLTIGRTDAGLLPLNENAIRNFISENSNEIEEAIQTIIADYEDDGELDQLSNPENSMILEYLYDYIDTGVEQF